MLRAGSFQAHACQRNKNVDAMGSTAGVEKKRVNEKRLSCFVFTTSMQGLVYQIGGKRPSRRKIRPIESNANVII